MSLLASKGADQAHTHFMFNYMMLQEVMKFSWEEFGM